MPAAEILQADLIRARAKAGDSGRRVLVADAEVTRNRHQVLAFDVSAFARNPIVLWAHDDRRPPIGSASGVTLTGSGTPAMRLEADLDFDPAQEFAAAVADLWDRELLNSVSYGALPLPGHPPVDVFDESTGRWLYTQYPLVELLEITVCPIGAGRNAHRVAASLGLGRQAEIVLGDGGPLRAAHPLTTAPTTPDRGSVRPLAVARMALNRARLEGLRQGDTR